MFQDDDLVMLSALQHYQFCPRQCALIHMEGIWSDNFLTASGTDLHKHVDSNFKETRADVHTASTLRLVSHKLGMIGVADLVEFHRCNCETDENKRKIASRIPGYKGFWKPFPVEYKHGKPNLHRADEVQLCAQAICLEEMLNVEIAYGALFYGEIRRRTDVFFNNELRELTEHVAKNVHKLLSDGVLPEAKINKGCDACSLVDICRPTNFQRNVSAKLWLDRTWNEIIS